MLCLAGCRFTTYEQLGIRMLAPGQLAAVLLASVTMIVPSDHIHPGRFTNKYVKQACRVVNSKSEYTVAGWVRDSICVGPFSHLQY